MVHAETQVGAVGFQCLDLDHEELALIRHLEQAVALQYQVSLLGFRRYVFSFRGRVHARTFGASLWAQSLLLGILSLVR